MPFNTLFLDESGSPACNQPVPLRLVPVITNWPVELLLSLIALGIEQNGQSVFLIDCFIYDDTDEPKAKHKEFYKDLLDTSTGIDINNIPNDHFVWSDDLKKAFSNYIDLTCGREVAQNSGIKLVWNPDTSAIREDVERCPDFGMLLPEDILNTNPTIRKYAGWCAHRQDLNNSGDPKFQRKNGMPN